MVRTFNVGKPYTGLEYLFGIAIIIHVSCFMGCGKETVNDRQGEDEMPSMSIEDVLQEHTDELMSIEGVVGTAIGECEGNPCIKVFVVQKTSELQKMIPTSLEGYPVSVVETGEIKALDEN
ncbi:MAG: hypothetical protein ACE5H0_09715 [Bacteroidota bacterium]